MDVDLNGKTAIVTGAGSGIGAAFAKMLAERGGQVTVVDRDADAASAVAARIGTEAEAIDVADPEALLAMIGRVEERWGPVDILVSNAGIARGEPDHAASAPDEVWAAMWDIHVMAHVRAARAVLPGMIERGSGTLIQVVSAAGLLSQIGDAAYSATKHAALGFAEALAISHGDDGVRVVAVCPQYVATPMIGADEDMEHPQVIAPGAVVVSAMEALRDGRFLALPHPQVADYAAFKGADPDGWIKAMQGLRRRILSEGGSFDLNTMFRHL